jgi:predicted GNAT family acetyltransferase
VASLSRHLLDSGFSFGPLFADLANPTSNHLYKKIGYRPICDFVEWRLAAASLSADHGIQGETPKTKI